MSDELRFASVEEACQYLADVTEEDVVISHHGVVADHLDKVDVLKLRRETEKWIKNNADSPLWEELATHGLKFTVQDENDRPSLYEVINKDKELYEYMTCKFDPKSCEDDAEEKDED